MPELNEPFAQAAAEKLVEAEHFFKLMEKTCNRPERDFAYYASAYVAALYSLKEKVKKYRPSTNVVPVRERRSRLLKDSRLKVLMEIRRRETHLLPVSKDLCMTWEFPGGLRLTHDSPLEIVGDLSADRTIYRVGTDGPFTKLPTSHHWVFDRPGLPDVLETCREGLDVARSLVATVHGE